MTASPLLSELIIGGVVCLLGILLVGFWIGTLIISGKISQEEERRESQNHK